MTVFWSSSNAPRRACAEGLSISVVGSAPIAAVEEVMCVRSESAGAASDGREGTASEIRLVTLSDMARIQTKRGNSRSASAEKSYDTPTGMSTETSGDNYGRVRHLRRCESSFFVVYSDTNPACRAFVPAKRPTDRIITSLIAGVFVQPAKTLIPARLLPPIICSVNRFGYRDRYTPAAEVLRFIPFGHLTIAFIPPGIQAIVCDSVLHTAFRLMRVCAIWETAQINEGT